MAKLTQMTGVNDFLRNLSMAKDVIAAKVSRGLKKGGLHLQRKSQEICPRQLGTLVNSAFTRNVGGIGFDTDIIVGYTVDYATIVHEDLTRAHGEEFNIRHAEEIAAAEGTPRSTARGGMFRRGENQQAKFLERPARDERRAIIKIIQREARI